MNSFITTKIACEKLQLGPNKCFVLHTGKKHEDFKNIELFVEGWSMINVKNVEKCVEERKDILEGDLEISYTGAERYLGQIISSDGTNTNNIEKGRNKGISLQN